MTMTFLYFLYIKTGSQGGDIILEFRDRKIYWTKYYNNDVERANFDGSDREFVVVDRPYVYGLAVDSVNR